MNASNTIINPSGIIIHHTDTILLSWIFQYILWYHRPCYRGKNLCRGTGLESHVATFRGARGAGDGCPMEAATAQQVAKGAKGGQGVTCRNAAGEDSPGRWKNNAKKKKKKILIRIVIIIIILTIDSCSKISKTSYMESHFLSHCQIMPNRPGDTRTIPHKLLKRALTSIVVPHFFQCCQ